MLQRYIAGLRADTDVQYRAKTLRGTPWKNLHLPPIRDNCALTTVLQAMMVLQGLPSSHAGLLHKPKTKQMQALVQEAFERPVEAGANALMRYLSHVPTLAAESIDRASPQYMGIVAAYRIRAGELPVVRLSRKARDYFAIVVGTEVVAGQTPPRALLVLDAYASAPWATFYNARLDLQRPKRKPANEADHVLTYRFLDGEVHEVQVKGLVFIREVRPP